MAKKIFFYGDAEIKKHGGLSGLKEFARGKRYQLREAALSTVDGDVEEADEYLGAVPEHYKQASEDKAVEDAAKATEGAKSGEGKDPTA